MNETFLERLNIIFVSLLTGSKLLKLEIDYKNSDIRFIATTVYSKKAKLKK